MPAAVIYTVSAMLFIGVAHLPYGYYTFLRLVACAAFAFAAFIAYDRKNNVLPWIYGLVALVFNPFIPVHFQKEVWIAIDLAAGILLLSTSNKVKTNSTNADTTQI